MGQAASIACPDSFSLRTYLRAARVGDLDGVQRCLDRRDSNVNAASMTNMTAMHLACKEGHVDIVRELLHQNADINQSTQKGNTPLHIASMHGQADIVSLLVANGAELNAKSKRGYTALYLAATENHVATASILLENGADHTIGPDDSMKVTPLTIAELQGYEEIVNLIKDKTTWAEPRPGSSRLSRTS